MHLTRPIPRRFPTRAGASAAYSTRPCSTPSNCLAVNPTNGAKAVRPPTYHAAGTTALGRNASHAHTRNLGLRFSSTSTNTEVTLPVIRNISAWGHIDAGKTTLTERLLYHTGGLLSSPNAVDAAAVAANSALPGDVDMGSTVTDFLEQERERGITIQSAAVGPLWWRSSSRPFSAATNSTSQSKTAGDASQSGAITLIDTPGHIDFTIEVERALRVADGCIVVMDSVEGVEAQTETNWKIGKRYGVQSNLLFLNKLDRVGASVSRSLRSFISVGLHPTPLLLQLPRFPTRSSSDDVDGGIEGVVDLLDLEEVHFEGRAGEEMTRSPISSEQLQREAKAARHALVETLASLDETLMEELFSIETDGEPHEHVSAQSLRASIRKLTIAGKVVPTFLGSAHKNVGVQPLLDGVVDFLPSPKEAGDARDEAGKGNGTVYATSERSRLLKTARGKKARGKAKVVAPPAPGQAAASRKQSAAVAEEGPAAAADQDGTESPEAEQVEINVEDKDLSALAFKVVWDKRKGPMTFVRVYSGVLNSSTTLLNTTTGTKERLNKLLVPFGSMYTEVDKLVAGQVGVLLGLHDTKTGDTLLDFRASASANVKSGRLDPTLRLRRVDVPPPVFSVSVEPHSKSDEASVNEALAMLVRTDPSLRLDTGADDAGGGSAFGAAGSNQTLLSGMGELHLEIAKDRLKNEFGVKARIGGVRVSFRETLPSSDGEGRAPEEQPWNVVDEVVERDMGGKKVKVGMRVAVKPLPQGQHGDEDLGGNVVDVQLDGEEVLLGNLDTRSELKRVQRNQEAVTGDHPSTRSGAAIDEQAATPAAAGSGPALDADALNRSITSGIAAALSRGPLSSHPLTALHVRVSHVRTFSPELSPPKAVTAIANSLLRKAVREAGARMMEPVMRVRIETGESHLGRVVGDVTTEQAGEIVTVEHEEAAAEGGVSVGAGAGEQRQEYGVYIPHDSIGSVGGGGLVTSSGGSSSAVSAGPGPRQKTTVVALVPLSKLVSYSTRLRALTAGGGTYTMRLEGFREVSEDRQRSILEELGRI